MIETKTKKQNKKRTKKNQKLLIINYCLKKKSFSFSLYIKHRQKVYRAIYTNIDELYKHLYIHMY